MINLLVQRWEEMGMSRMQIGLSLLIAGMEGLGLLNTEGFNTPEEMKREIEDIIQILQDRK